MLTLRRNEPTDSRSNAVSSTTVTRRAAGIEAHLEPHLGFCFRGWGRTGARTRSLYTLLLEAYEIKA